MSEISRELRDALIAFEVAVRTHECLGDADGRGVERVERVGRARERLIAAIREENHR